MENTHIVRLKMKMGLYMVAFDGFMTECSLRIFRLAVPLLQGQGQLSLLLRREGML